ncbi:MAG: class I SAM-dependent methyltransferase [Methylomonas sp.]
MKTGISTNRWVKESAFGIWFLNTETWQRRVLKVAITDLEKLLQEQRHFPAILDVGCGRGNAFRLLEEHFKPDSIFGIEIDRTLLADAAQRGRQCRCNVNITAGNAEAMPFPDQSFDMVFCHQSFHHIVRHEQAMQAFYRVLKPGGVLLFAESCKRFIHSWPIRLLFRHPMHVQKTAGEYLALIKNHGFMVDEQCISTPYLWWSRPDIGALEWFGLPMPEQREATLLNLVAVK